MMEEIIIKAEPQEFEYTNPQMLMEDIALNDKAESAQCAENLKSRCGEIFVTNNAKKWTFTCTYCNKTTRDVGEFICHIQFKHMNGQYTEDDNNSDELQSMEASYTEHSFKNQEQNILLQTLNKTEDPAQTFPLTTPTVELVSSLANTNSTLTFEASTNFGCSASAKNSEEFRFDAATSQLNSENYTASSTEIINRGKRKLDTPKDMKTEFTIILKNQAKMLALLTQNSKKVKKTTEGIKKANDSERVAADSYVSIILDIIFLRTLKESFQRLFATELIIIYNFDGVSDKSSLKEYKHLIDAIFDREEDDVHNVENLNRNNTYNITEKEHNEMQVDEENDEFIGDDGMEYNTLLCIKEEPQVNEQTPRDIHIQQRRKPKIKQTKISPMKCQYCNKEFKTKQALSNHTKTHTKTNEYQCPMCSLCHSTENQFITHVLMHESDTCFPCMVCGKDLKSNEERDEHLTSHLEERPFGCHFCKRRFRQQNFLTNHLRIHCQYRCDFCPSDFRSMQTQRRPYACPQCEEQPDVKQKVESQRALTANNQTVETDADTDDKNKKNFRKSTDILLFAYKPPEKVCGEGGSSIPPESMDRKQCQYCSASFINDNNLINHLHKKHEAARKTIELNDIA